MEVPLQGSVDWSAESRSYNIQTHGKDKDILELRNVDIMKGINVLKISQALGKKRL